MPVSLKLVFWGYEFMQTEYLIVSLPWKCYFILCITKWCYICSTLVQSRLYKLKYCTRKYAESLEEMCCEELSAVSQETLMQSWKENFPHSRQTSHLHLQKFVNAVYSLCVLVFRLSYIKTTLSKSACKLWKKRKAVSQSTRRQLCLLICNSMQVVDMPST